MNASDLYDRRRRALAAGMGGAHVVVMGHSELGRNYPHNVLPFRQDSSFLFYAGSKRADAAVVVHPDGASTLYLPVPQPDDALWLGDVASLDAEAEAAGVAAVKPRSALAADLAALRDQGAQVVALPVTQSDARRAVTRMLDGSDDAPWGDAEWADRALQTCIAQRLYRDEAEVQALREAAQVTERAFRLAMAATRPGITDFAVDGLISGVFRANGCEPAYPPIVTPRGEILHGRARGDVLEDGQLLLVDAGAEHALGLATDVTRTWPVSGQFEGRQWRVYEAVLASQKAAIDACRPGRRYRDIHLEACRVLAGAAVEWGLLRGDVDGLVEQGAHAVFFPHGVGHLIGLDVHDMELFGDAAGYAPGRSRSSQFGLGYLRLDRDLEAGMSVTIEPGFYLAPAILADRALRERLGDSVAWSEAERWLPFGGIRIEDDVLVTERDPQVLTAGIPKTSVDVQAAVGKGMDLTAWVAS